MRHRIAIIGLALTLLTIGSVGAAPDFSAAKLQPYDAPKPAPAFTLPDPDGRATTLGELRGKVVLLFFWATW